MLLPAKGQHACSLRLSARHRRLTHDSEPTVARAADDWTDGDISPSGEVLDAMPVIPLWHDDVVHLVSRQWQGWKVTAHNRLDLRHVERMPSGTP